MRILVCPLDWGLGHATRSIPLIRALLANGHQVRIGAAGGGLRLLRAEFPDLDVFEFPGYTVRYARSPRWFLPVMLMQLPSVLLGMRSDSRRLRSILAAHPADLVVSDGRYGVRSETVPSIFITHQVFIRVPGRFPGSGLAEKLILALNLRRLRAFDRVWVPDVSGSDSLSGELSHGSGLPGNLEFIGLLSRFTPEHSDSADSELDSDPESRQPHRGEALPEVDILAVVSGPEPQRTLFETELRKQLAAMAGTRVLVRGLPSDGSGPVPDLTSIAPSRLTEFAHLPGSSLAHLFSTADMVVARSGYTTVMELAGLGARAALLVPTPGQSEQEYLADHLEKMGAAVRMDQDGLDLASARERLRDRPGFRRWERPSDAVGLSPGASAPVTAPLRVFLSAHPLLRGRSGS
jgi:UDP:flavonoid glycosyltransferase YjiC (YdhE family)